MKNVLGWSWVLVVLVACSASPQPPEGGQTGWIEITPGSFTLTEPAASLTLSAVVFDANGDPVAADVTWHSSDAGVVRVDADGTATAMVAVGSAQITARAEGLESGPVLALVAQPVPGALLVSDDRVLGEPVAVDPEANLGLGWEYQVTLRDVGSLSVGTIVVGTGAKHVGGRVTAATPTGSDVVVTLEVLPLDELFVALSIDESFDLTHAALDVPEEIARHYDVLELRDGTIELVPRDATTSVLHPEQLAGTRALGVFTCTTTSSFPFSMPQAPSFTIKPTLSYDLDYTLAGGLTKLSTKGTVTAEFKYEPKVSASFEGTLACEVELASLVVPIGGPAAFILGGQVPLGVGFELKGKLVLAELGLAIEAKADASLEIGLTCQPDTSCSPIFTGSSNLDPKLTPKFPNIDEQFKLEAEVHAFAFADIALGSRLFRGFRTQALRFTAGLKQTLNLATTTAQVKDTNYASSFELHLLVEGKIGTGIDEVMKFLKITVDALRVELVNQSLGRSPQGTFVIAPASVEPAQEGELGEMATFTIELDPVTYLALESVEKVEIFWKEDGEEGAFTLEPGRPSCTEVTGGAGQKTFECETDFREEHAGEQTFYAFVHAKFYGIPLPIPLEIAKDAKAHLHVGTATCPIPPEAFEAGVVDESETTSGSGTSSMVRSIDYGAVSANIRSQSAGGWSPDVNLDAQFSDSIYVIPNAPWSEIGELTLRFLVMGSAAASRDRGWTSGGLCYGDDAEIQARMMGVDLRVRLCGEVTGSDQVTEVVEWTASETSGWHWFSGSLEGRVRAQEDGDVSEASLSMNAQFVGAVDATGNAVPVTLCSASGTSY